jgi:hypothetical protein
MYTRALLGCGRLVTTFGVLFGAPQDGSQGYD